MSSAPPPVPSQPVENAVPALSQVQRVISALAAPSKTFADIRRSAMWWAPWLLIFIASMAFSMVFAQKMDFEQMVRQQIANSSRAQQFESLPKDQQERQIALGAKVGKVFSYAAPAVGLLLSLFLALVLWGTFNFIHDADLSFGRSMAIVIYSSLPSVVYLLLGTITLLLKSDTEGMNPRNLVATNIAYFLDSTSAPKFLYGMAGAIDIITIWTIALLGLGFKINSANRRLSTGTAVATIAGLYLAYKLIVSALGFV
ncbi:MAG TPA: YIP1 family protein [Candidatus Saccharimonadales bacterium]|jgi:hypothetical protein|nr:YIP1 family protein [Candidatus Saccharimonadales bacterium]